MEKYIKDSDLWISLTVNISPTEDDELFCDNVIVVAVS